MVVCTIKLNRFEWQFSPPKHVLKNDFLVYLCIYASPDSEPLNSTANAIAKFIVLNKIQRDRER